MVSNVCLSISFVLNFGVVGVLIITSATILIAYHVVEPHVFLYLDLRLRARIIKIYSNDYIYIAN